MMLLPVFMQHPVVCSFRPKVLTFIEQYRDNLARWQALKTITVAFIQNGLLLRFRELVYWFRTLCARSFVRQNKITVFPALYRSGTQAYGFTGFRLTSTGVYSLLDKAGQVLSIWERGQSSSDVPQISRTFFERTSKAAVSANALSLRLSSRSSFFMVCLSLLCSSDNALRRTGWLSG